MKAWVAAQFVTGWGTNFYVFAGGEVSNKRSTRTFDPKANDFKGWIMEFQTESDRAAAVLGAAYVDSMLETLLRSHFTHDESEANILFDPSGPLGGFAARNRLAYCLGLISESQFKDIKRIAKIRNQFAHHLHGVNFESDSVKGQCENLITPKRPPGDQPEMPPRALYIMTVAIIGNWLSAYSLEAKRKRCTRRDEPPAGFTFPTREDLHPYK